jgi:shikimate kinase/3-dehydroquinate synthase
LSGLSGVGKSTVGALLAERLGVGRLIDTDGAALGRRRWRSGAGDFRVRGEEAFRAMEREVLARALVEDRIVVATGGGAVVAEDAWSEALLGRRGTLVVALDAEPGTSLHRLRAQLMQEGGAAERPLLTGGDPLERLAEMKAQRAAAYDRATVTLPVDHSPPNVIVDDLVQMVVSSDAARDITLETPSGTSSILVGPGLFRDLGRLVRQRWRSAHRVWIVSDENVGAIFGDRAGESLEAAGFAVHHLLLPPGEGSKSVAGVSSVWDWMLGTGVERSDVAIALGGGVVGDLAGFAAATVLRGIGLAQVPTTLQAMVDASVGGKTGINHPAGKNLIGAFHQPSLVVIDPGVAANRPFPANFVPVGPRW